MTNDTTQRCWIYGDEGGNIGTDRFFCIGIVGTRKPDQVEQILKDIRKKTVYSSEISYKSSNDRRALCAIRWVDWFFSNQELASFKLLVKDRGNFDIKYYKDNYFKTGEAQLAYCESYREVLCNFADFNNDNKIFTYSQKSLMKMKVSEYLDGKVNGLNPGACFEGSPKKRKPYSVDFTQEAELLQLCDLLTSSTLGLYKAIHNIGTNKSWVKKTLQLNLLYHIPGLRKNIVNLMSFYHPLFQPFSSQKYVIFQWKPRTPKHL